jgi:hypothetical protein
MGNGIEKNKKLLSPEIQGIQQNQIESSNNQGEKGMDNSQQLSMSIKVYQAKKELEKKKKIQIQYRICLESTKQKKYWKS